MRHWRRVLARVDQRVFWYLHLTIARRWLDWCMGLVTHLGGVFPNAGMGLGLVGLGGDGPRRAGLATLTALATSHLVVRLLKRQFERPRPYLALAGSRLVVTPLSDHSFPSGHTAASFATATVLAAHWPVLALPAMVAATLVGVSRTYLGHHYPSDVVAGALIGVIFAYLSLARFPL